MTLLSPPPAFFLPIQSTSDDEGTEDFDSDHPFFKALNLSPRWPPEPSSRKRSKDRKTVLQKLLAIEGGGDGEGSAGGCVGNDGNGGGEEENSTGRSSGKTMKKLGPSRASHSISAPSSREGVDSASRLAGNPPTSFSGHPASSFSRHPASRNRDEELFEEDWSLLGLIDSGASLHDEEPRKYGWLY